MVIRVAKHSDKKKNTNNPNFSNATIFMYILIHNIRAIRAIRGQK